MTKRKPPGKWIDGLSAEMPVLDAAERVLDLRLKAVEIMLPLAVERADEATEHIHQLRVATRRADTALRMFKPCVKSAKYKKARNALTRLRRAAGDARECDVHGEVFRTARREAPEAHKAFYDDLIGWNGRQRRGAQKAVKKESKRYPIEKLRQRRKDLVGSLGLRGRFGRATDASENGETIGPTFRGLSLITLPRIAGKFRAAAAEDLSLLSNLHQLRIRGKRLRYALEVFKPCFGGEFKSRYELVVTLQDELGAINDSHEMLQRLTLFIEPEQQSRQAERGDDRWRDAAADVLRRFHRRREAQVNAFLEHWRSGCWATLMKIGLNDADQTGTAANESSDAPMVEVNAEAAEHDAAPSEEASV